jgi:hypothetical protein
MRMKLGVAVVGFGFLVSAVPMLAHHSFAAMYDANKPVSLKGKVTNVQFRNPHIWVFADITQPDGKTVNWGCEGGNPNSLFRQGWTPDMMKVGDVVTMEGFAGRDGKPVCNLRNMISANGKKMFVGTLNDGAPALPANP